MSNFSEIKTGRRLRKSIGAFVLGLFACNPAFCQEISILREGKVMKTSYRIDNGSKRHAIRIGSNASDSVFLPVRVKVINLASIDNNYGIMLETEDKHYIYLENIRTVFVQKGQGVPKGKVIGQVFFDSSYHLNLLDISIKKGQKDLHEKELLKYLSSLK